MSTNRIIELCLVFLISILSFSIGTYVGKKYSDNQHKLALLDPNYSKTLTAQENEQSVQKEHGTDLVKTDSNSVSINDADVAKMAEEFSEDEITATEKEDSTHLVKTIEEDGTPVAHTTTPAPSPKKVNAAEVKREVAHIAEKVKNMTADGKNAKYTVQIGSFPSATEAEKIVSSLQARGYKATQVEANVNGKTWHRVQVGLFSNLEEAQSYKKELIEKNRLTSAIISKINE
jgi:DedD protein